MSRYFILLLLCLTACSETSGPDSPFKAADLSHYFAPPSSLDRQKWHFTDFTKVINDSFYYFEYVGKSQNSTFDGYSPISIYKIVDTSLTFSRTREYFVSDSLVISYGASALSPDHKVILLRDTLYVGKKWRAADSYLTPDSQRITIDAAVSEYYPTIHISDSTYNDAFRIVYTVSSVGAESSYPEFQDSASYVLYFARYAGNVLRYIYDKYGVKIYEYEYLGKRNR